MRDEQIDETIKMLIEMAADETQDEEQLQKIIWDDLPEEARKLLACQRIEQLSVLVLALDSGNMTKIALALENLDLESPDQLSAADLEAMDIISEMSREG
jgi:hypothetical protein